MKIKNKVCLTTFISGEKYQDYMPFLVYSCHESYPEYDILLFLHESLRPSIKEQIDVIGAKNVFFVENAFSDIKKMTPLKAMSLRWVLWDERFRFYDYLYIVDIDMLYFKETKPLHEQHVEHMATTGLPFDNMVRHRIRDPFSYYSLGSRIKHAGFKSIFRFLFGDKNEYLLSGLQFIEVQPYFNIFTSNIRAHYLNEIRDESFLSYCMRADNEVLLYHMMAQLFGNLDKLGVQSNATASLDFNNTARAEFRPHHGIHMGIFRVDKTPGTDETLDSKTYHYYLEQFVEKYKKDPIFIKILDISSDRIKDTFKRMYYYYGLK